MQLEGKSRFANAPADRVPSGPSHNAPFLPGCHSSRLSIAFLTQSPNPCFFLQSGTLSFVPNADETSRAAENPCTGSKESDIRVNVSGQASQLHTHNVV